MTGLEALGWIGNASFFSRWIVQWYASERAKKSVAPVSFWWLSLLGTALLGTYTLLEGEPILLVGYVVNVAIYGRNLLLQSPESRRLQGPGLALAALVFAVSLVGLALLTADAWNFTEPAWVAVGLAGLFVWNGRWPLQWWYSERQGRSHFPAAFWWISRLGASLQLAYTLHLGKAVWIVSYIATPLIQVRNLMLTHRAAARDTLVPEPRRTEAAAPRETDSRTPARTP